MRLLSLLFILAISVSAQVSVTVDPTTTFQTQKYNQIDVGIGPGNNCQGVIACNPDWATLIEAPHWSKLVNELGINTVNLPIQAIDVESPSVTCTGYGVTSYFNAGVLGTSPAGCEHNYYHLHLPTPDGADTNHIRCNGVDYTFASALNGPGNLWKPSGANPTCAEWFNGAATNAMVDYAMDNYYMGANGFRQTVLTAGKTPHLEISINNNLLDFMTNSASSTAPQEWAKAVMAVLIHLQNKYGVTAGLVGIVNEPDLNCDAAAMAGQNNSLGSPICQSGRGAGWYTPTTIANRVNALVSDLSGLISTNIVCCSTTNTDNAVASGGGVGWYNQVKAITGSGEINILGFHTYGGSIATETAIATQATADGIPALNTEYEILSIDNNTHNEIESLLFSNSVGAKKCDSSLPISGGNTISPTICFLVIDSEATWQTGTGSTYSSHYVVGNESSFHANGPTWFFAQLFGYVPEGSVREKTTFSGPGGTGAVAYKAPDGTHRVVVITGSTASQAFNVTGLPAGTYGCTYTTGNGANFKQSCGSNQTITTGGTVSYTLQGVTQALGTTTIAATIFTSLPTNQWFSTNPIGDYPMTPIGYDACSFTGATHDTVVCFVNYLTGGVTSEGQDALMQYSYTTNRREVLVDGGGWHGDHRSDMGHQMGVQFYVPSLDSVLWQSNYNFANSVNNYLTMYGFDMAGLTGYELPIMTSTTSGGAITRVWQQNSGGELGAAVYEPVSGKFVVFPDQRQATSDAQICTIGTALSITCVSSGGSGPTALGNIAMVAQGGLVWFFGGGSQQVWTLNPATGVWALITTTCSGADCSSTAPSARWGPAVAWSVDDSLMLFAGGSTVEGGGSALIDTYTFNPATNAFTEVCGPSVNTSNCSVFSYVVTKPGNRLVYDTVNHVFIWVQPNGGIAALSLGTVPLKNYGSVTNVYNPAVGSLNKTSPGSNNNTQGWASDPSLSISGSTIYLSHIETGTPATGGNCQVPLPYIGVLTASSTISSSTISYSPIGSLATGCAAIGGNTARATPSSHPFSAVVNGTLWNVFSKENVDNNLGAVISMVFAQAYNAGTGLWNVPNFPPQAPGGSLSVGSQTITLSPFPTGVTTNSVLRIFGGTGTEETVPVTNVNAGASQVTVTVANTHTGAWTISDSGWMTCFSRACTYTSDAKLVQYPQGLIAVGNTPTAAVIEQDRNQFVQETYLYVAQLGANWAALGNSGTCVSGGARGCTPINFNAPGSGTGVTGASIATDGGGTNIAACWTEWKDDQAGGNRWKMLVTPQVYCKKWNGSSWSLMGPGSLNNSASNWAGDGTSVAYYNGTYWVAWTERAASGWPNVYVANYNSGSNTWTTSAALNVNAQGVDFHPALATDGTTLYLAWEEQSAINRHARGFLKSTTGSGWVTLASNIAADAVNGSIEDMGIVARAGVITAAWSEMSTGNLRQMYAQSFSNVNIPSFNAPLTIQEELIPGTNGFSGLTRTNDPLTVGVPIPDSVGLTTTANLGLTGASAAQFTVEANWPSGNIKWVKVRAIVPSVTAGTVNAGLLTLNNGGAGNFGGPNLATDNGSTITVSTNGGTCGSGSAVCFTIKKSHYNFIDQVQIGSTTVVSTGASTGVVVAGPPATGTYPANVTCSPTSGGAACTTLFTSANDGTNSTCSIEENGPAVAVIKCSSDLNDGAAHVYMHQTTREYFYQGRSQVKYTTVLRNADYGTSGTFATASKGFNAFEIRIAPNISGTLTYQVANDSGVTSGSMSGTDTTYLYQAESNLAKPANWCNSACKPPSSISGYAIMNNGSALLTGDASHYVPGWADIADASGVGVMIGQDQLAAYGNKSLEFRGGGSDVRIGLWAAENNTTSPSTTTPNAPYYQVWPEWSIHNGWLEFHTTAPASPANDHLMLQYPLLARAGVAWYNSTGAFPDPLLDPTEENTFYSSTLSTASPSVSAVSALDSVMGTTANANQTCNARGSGSIPTVCVYRYWAWAAPGGANQMEYHLSGLHNFLRRGFTGQYANASYFYKFVNEDAFPMSDGFAWTSHAGETKYFGFPTATSANTALSIAGTGGLAGLNIEADHEHANWQGYDTYYLMSGDETIKDGYMEAVPPFFANSASSNNYTTVSAGLWNDRSIGNFFKGVAHMYLFLNSVGDATDATTILTNAETVYAARLQPNFCANPGFPTGCTQDVNPVNSPQAGSPPLAGSPQPGTSQVRGVSNVFKDTSVTVSGACSGIITSNAPRTAKPFMASRKLEGMWEFYNVVPPGWSNRVQFFDYMYGTVQWAFGEMLVDDGTNSWTNNSLRYAEAIDYPNACNSAGDWGVLGNVETVWYHWVALQQYLGPLSATNVRLFKQMLQRDSSNGNIDEFYHETIGTAIYNILHPQANPLQTLQITSFINNGGGSYTLGWKTPAGATSFRAKWGTLPIVDWIGFNAGTYAFIGNPSTSQNWFTSTEIVGMPAPVVGTQTFTVTGLGNTTLTASDFMVKVFAPQISRPPTQHGNGLIGGRGVILQ